MQHPHEHGSYLRVEHSPLDRQSYDIPSAPNFANTSTHAVKIPPRSLFEASRIWSWLILGLSLVQLCTVGILEALLLSSDSYRLRMQKSLSAHLARTTSASKFGQFPGPLIVAHHLTMVLSCAVCALAWYRALCKTARRWAAFAVLFNYVTLCLAIIQWSEKSTGPMAMAQSLAQKIGPEVARSAPAIRTACFAVTLVFSLLFSLALLPFSRLYRRVRKCPTYQANVTATTLRTETRDRNGSWWTLLIAHYIIHAFYIILFVGLVSFKSADHLAVKLGLIIAVWVVLLISGGLSNLRPRSPALLTFLGIAVIQLAVTIGATAHKAPQRTVGVHEVYEPTYFYFMSALAICSTLLTIIFGGVYFTRSPYKLSTRAYPVENVPY
ncbi:hypothetical protein IWQ62_002977 [Dispira parvispora]|uniref:Uncharacterized protein n=1 Tax=Dispira parvispora TaxID=1520584 RepID=A0A9W8APG4_9FUNG|nr:hypothetical protein IWQ62_002977 [Dispira parvispora]